MRKCGWAGIKNGRLLALATASFDVLITADRNIEHQQNVATLPLSVLVLVATSNRMEAVEPLVPDILKAGRCAACSWTRIFFGWRPNLRDEGDHHLVELAVAGGAGCIVTRNVRDLIAMELKFPALAVGTPEQFMKEPAS